MRRHFASLPCFALALALTGCGSLAPRDESSLATVRGALRGELAAGTRVALVWRGGPTRFFISHDVPVQDGTFSIALTNAPPGALFSALDSGDAPTSVQAPSDRGDFGEAPSGGSGSESSAQSLGTREVVGGVVRDQLSVAVAGFVLYRDTNGNEHFDLDSNGNTSDVVVGGARHFVLSYLRDGTTLDIEKLRTIAGPSLDRGYNVLWTERGRWVPLDSIELTAGDARLPSQVCSKNSVTLSGGQEEVSSHATSPAGAPLSDPGAGPTEPSAMPYPSSADPSLRCSSDGRSYTYDRCGSAQPIEAESGLCAPETSATSCNNAVVALGSDPSAPIPSGWPCPIGKQVDPSPSPPTPPQPSGP